MIKFRSITVTMALFLLVSGFLYTLSAQKSVVPIHRDSLTHPQPNHFYYALPQSVLKVEVVVHKRMDMKGHYAAYAEKLLGLSNVISQNKTSYKLHNVTITPITLCDGQHYYEVALSENQKKSNYIERLYRTLAADDTVRQGRYEVKQRATIPDFFRYYADLTYREESNEYVETQIVDGVVRQVKANKVQKVNVSAEQMAVEAADMISKIRSDRYDLLVGAHEVPYSGDALALMLEQLNQMEKNYIELFTGFTLTEEQCYTFYITPNSNEVQSFAFAFAEQTGLTPDTSVMASENFYLHYAPQNLNPSMGDYVEQQVEVKKQKIGEGYRFRRPVPVTITLTQQTKGDIELGTFSLYQWGRVEMLPAQYDEFPIEKYAIIY